MTRFTLLDDGRMAARKALGAVITCEECDGEGCLTCNGTGSQGGEG